jgi:Flp pilus assembly protein TadB
MSDTHPPQPSAAEMLGDVVDLMGGLAVVLLPLWIIAIPGVVLLLVLPAVLILAVVAVPVLVVGAVATPPVLLVRAIRRRRSAREQPRVDYERRARHVARAV